MTCSRPQPPHCYPLISNTICPLESSRRAKERGPFLQRITRNEVYSITRIRTFSLPPFNWHRCATEPGAEGAAQGAPGRADTRNAASISETRPDEGTSASGAAQHLRHAGLGRPGQNRAQELRRDPAGPWWGLSRLPQLDPSPYRPPWRGGTSHPTPPAASGRARRRGGRVRACLATSGGRAPGRAAPRGVVGTGMAVLGGAGAACGRQSCGGGRCSS